MTKKYFQKHRSIKYDNDILNFLDSSILFFICNYLLYKIAASILAAVWYLLPLGRKLVQNCCVNSCRSLVFAPAWSQTCTKLLRQFLPQFGICSHLVANLYKIAASILAAAIFIFFSASTRAWFIAADFSAFSYNCCRAHHAFTVKPFAVYFFKTSDFVMNVVHSF